MRASQRPLDNLSQRDEPALHVASQVNAKNSPIAAGQNFEIPVGLCEAKDTEARALFGNFDVLCVVGVTLPM